MTTLSSIDPFLPENDSEFSEDALAWLLKSPPDARIKAEILEVAQIFGDAIADIRYFAPGTPVSIGGKSAFQVPHSCAGPDQLLFEPEEDGSWTALLDVKWDAFVDRDSVRSIVVERKVRINPGATLVLDLGGPIFLARMVPRSPRIKLEPGPRDLTFPVMLASFAMIFSMLGSVLQLTPAPETAPAPLSAEAAVLLLQKPVDMPEPVKSLGEKKPAGKAAAPKKGGSETRDDKETVGSSGLLSALDADADLNDQLSNTGLSGDMLRGIPGMIGSKGTQEGLSLGERGSGIGCNGDVVNCTGRIDGIGSVGTRPGKGPGEAGTMGPRDEPKISLPGDSIVLGSLDPSLIDAVIKRNLSSIRYCYQRELAKNPALQGKVKVKFVIAGDGSVSSATTAISTLGNASVESCINGRILRMSFPTPKQGIVIVSYPFVFSAG